MKKCLPDIRLNIKGEFLSVDKIIIFDLITTLI